MFWCCWRMSRRLDGNILLPQTQMENVQDLFFVATNGTWNCSDIGHECPNVSSEASGLSPGHGSKTVFVAAKTFVVRSLSDLWGQFVLLVKLHVQFHLDWFGNLNDLWCDTQLVRNMQWSTRLYLQNHRSDYLTDSILWVLPQCLCGGSESGDVQNLFCSSWSKLSVWFFTSDFIL